MAVLLLTLVAIVVPVTGGAGELSAPDVNTLSVWATVFSAIATIFAAVAAWMSAASARKSAEVAATANRIEIARETLEVYNALDQVKVDFTGHCESINRDRTVILQKLIEKRRIYLSRSLRLVRRYCKDIR